MGRERPLREAGDKGQGRQAGVVSSGSLQASLAPTSGSLVMRVILPSRCGVRVCLRLLEEKGEGGCQCPSCSAVFQASSAQNERDARVAYGGGGHILPPSNATQPTDPVTPA